MTLDELPCSSIPELGIHTAPKLDLDLSSADMALWHSPLLPGELLQHFSTPPLLTYPDWSRCLFTLLGSPLSYQALTLALMCLCRTTLPTNLYPCPIADPSVLSPIMPRLLSCQFTDSCPWSQLTSLSLLVLMFLIVLTYLLLPAMQISGQYSSISMLS